MSRQRQAELCESEDRLVKQRVPGQPELQSEILPQSQNRNLPNNKAIFLFKEKHILKVFYYHEAK